MSRYSSTSVVLLAVAFETKYSDDEGGLQRSRELTITLPTGQLTVSPAYFRRDPTTWLRSLRYSFYWNQWGLPDGLDKEGMSWQWAQEHGKSTWLVWLPDGEFTGHYYDYRHLGYTSKHAAKAWIKLNPEWKLAKIKPLDKVAQRA